MIGKTPKEHQMSIFEVALESIIQHGTGEEHHVSDGREAVPEDHSQGAEHGPEEVPAASRD
ncbi:MAG: hypothetical protein J5871_05720 [Bacteroidales bacterium]|nr:hypothetical protein [Bacteroidales bacterium]